MINAFVRDLAQTPAPENCVNPYAENHAQIDATAQGALIRRRHLRSYLAKRRDTTKLLLIAEAPGYQGARFSGIAMTCERHLLGLKDGVDPAQILEPGIVPKRTSSQKVARNRQEVAGGFCEPTASIVWTELARHGISGNVVLWNVFPFHPHRPGNALSNRKPTDSEVAAHIGIVHRLIKMFDGARIACVGNTARDHLQGVLPPFDHLRHPANGGATLFRQQLGQIAKDI